MPSTAVRLVIDDPENFHLLTTDMKEQIIKGGIATVNVQAALARKNAITNLKTDFTLRNAFTASQIQFTQMPQGRFALSAIESRVGITEKAAYMARQETGGVRKPAGGGSSLAIPTSLARGGNRGSPVMKKNYLRELKRKTVGIDNADNSGRRLVAAAALGKVIRYNKGLFVVKNFVKKSDNRVSFKMDLIYTFKYKETVTPERKWLLPASEKPAQDVENIFISQMKKLGM